MDTLGRRMRAAWRAMRPAALGLALLAGGTQGAGAQRSPAPQDTAERACRNLSQPASPRATPGSSQVVPMFGQLPASPWRPAEAPPGLTTTPALVTAQLGITFADLVAPVLPPVPPTAPIGQLQPVHLMGEWEGMTPEGNAFVSQFVPDGRWILFNSPPGQRPPVFRPPLNLRWHMERQGGHTLLVFQRVSGGRAVQTDRVQVLAFDGATMRTRVVTNGIETSLRRSDRMACAAAARAMDHVWEIRSAPDRFFRDYRDRIRDIERVQRHEGMVRLIRERAFEIGCRRLGSVAEDAVVAQLSDIACGLRTAAVVLGGSGGLGAPVLVAGCLVRAYAWIDQVMSEAAFLEQAARLHAEANIFWQTRSTPEYVEDYRRTLARALPYAAALDATHDFLARFYGGMQDQFRRLDCQRFDPGHGRPHYPPVDPPDRLGQAGAGWAYFPAVSSTYLTGVRPFERGTQTFP